MTESLQKIDSASETRPISILRDPKLDIRYIQGNLRGSLGGRRTIFVPGSGMDQELVFEVLDAYGKIEVGSELKLDEDLFFSGQKSLPIQDKLKDIEKGRNTP